MAPIDVNDDTIDTPEYQRAYEQALAAWRETRASPMPHPDVPRIPPDKTLMMPMRDGARLYTELFLPNGATTLLPTVLIRTPYPDPIIPYSSRPIELFRQAGYAVATQACRGTWKSEGQFHLLQNEPKDGYDCVEWLAAQSWSNGRVGMYGSSYLGSTQWLAAKLKPPHLTCIAPQSPAAMFFYETPYVGGVLYKQWCLLAWPRLVSKDSWDEMGFDLGATELDKTSELYEATHHSPNLEAVENWHGRDTVIARAMCELLEHPTLDEWWRNIMLTPQTARNIDIPVFAITGFYDGDQAGCLYNWECIETNERSTANRRHLLVGPWRHAQMSTGKTAPMGEVTFGENADVSLPKSVLRFFDAYMKNDSAARERLPKRCRLYTSGSNVWYDVSHYPPKESVDTPLYLSSSGHANSLYGDGYLTFEVSAKASHDRLVVDWELLAPAVEVGNDARDNETRHDVLVYTSAPLDDDLTVLGPVRAMIYVAADAPDCDVVVRIEDVRPDGAAINMTGESGCGPFRARYREGFDREVLLTPGQPALLPFHVCHMGHTFKKGHRVRVAIGATVADMFEPNHHTGEPVATAIERRKAAEMIFHDLDRPSHIVLPVFRASDGVCEAAR